MLLLPQCAVNLKVTCNVKFFVLFPHKCIENCILWQLTLSGV